MAERLTFSPTTFEEATVRDDGSLELSFTREQAERFWSVLDEELRTPTGRLSRGR